MKKINAIIHILLTILFLIWFFNNEEFISKLKIIILDFLAINNDENSFNPVINMVNIIPVMLTIVIIFTSYKFFDSLFSNNKEFIFYAPLLAIPIYCVFFGFILTKLFWSDETYALFNSDNGYVVERGNDIKVYYKGKLVNVANAIHFKSYKESFENGVFKIDFIDKEDKILMQVFCGENNERSCRVVGR
ncbi:hypothetical protein L8W41_06970 [Campylobacter sp. IFREMER_LSEM_CL1904]|uniref:hypothetical protein n=1 Tax=Campylobacter sp. IFREMER_LSEM_CL1904 TaxID=2911616 RepID=UPI0021E633F7|nr:hypothetical protein [Campylobacter sp. IFREMER_LSEM_CL1904]MCV3428467.1 hypothetical protein [Campylobacter sp. IFREMER_LSEM_CL1904]